MNTNVTVNAAAKRAWTRPEVKRLEAGAAESQRGNLPDAGGGNQGS